MAVNLTINIQLNGKEHSIKSETSVAELIENLNLNKNAIAVECNMEIVARGTYHDYIIKNGDKIEIIELIGGG